MRTQRLFSIGLALAMLTGGLASAQNRDGRDDRPPIRNDRDRNDRGPDRGPGRGPDRADGPDGQRGQPSERRDLRPGERRDPRWDDRRGDNRRYAPPPGQPRGYDRFDRYDRHSRGAGPNHDFRPGYLLPPYYRSRQFTVDDWRGHRLSAPPRGYYWVQSGADYMLVAITTGLIIELLLGN